MTTLPLTGTLLTQYNNLPAIPFGNPLGNILNQLGGGGGGSQVIFSPGNPSPPDGVYTTWADAFAASSSKIGEVVILLDSSFAPTVVPAGTYDFEGRISLQVKIQIGNNDLTLSDGVVFENLTVVYGALSLVSLSSAPVIVVPDNTQTIFFMGLGTRIRADGTAPFVSVGVNSFFAAVLNPFVFIEAGVSSAVDLTDPTSGFLAFMYANSTVEDAISGTGVFIAAIASTSAMVTVPQTALLGVYATQIFTHADFLGYTPAVPVQWAGSPPDDGAEALDRLAAAVFGIIGPIP